MIEYLRQYIGNCPRSGLGSYRSGVKKKASLNRNDFDSSRRLLIGAFHAKKNPQVLEEGRTVPSFF